MAFISLTGPIRYDRPNDRHLYKFLDSEFGWVEFWVDMQPANNPLARGGSGWRCAAYIAKEYVGRNLPAGKNIALLVLYTSKNWGYSIEQVKVWQDRVCPEYNENWEQYAKERDVVLDKLMVLM